MLDITNRERENLDTKQKNVHVLLIKIMNLKLGKSNQIVNIASVNCNYS